MEPERNQSAEEPFVVWRSLQHAHCQDLVGAHCDIYSVLHEYYIGSTVVCKDTLFKAQCTFISINGIIFYRVL